VYESASVYATFANKNNTLQQKATNTTKANFVIDWLV
jgi:hypothetical protein